MTIFTNGVLDVLSVAHFNLLSFCRHMAGPDGKVIVAIDEDEKVMANKGLKRPIFTVHERAKAVLDLKIGDKPIIDQILFFHTDLELEMMIKRIQPDYIVKGADWENRHVVGSDVSKVAFFKSMPEYSTSTIISRILEKNQSI